jgi:hypothetical protein
MKMNETSLDFIWRKQNFRSHSKFNRLNDFQDFKIGSVIAQVVVWEKPNPTTKMATTSGHYTQCHLDIGPALRG